MRSLFSSLHAGVKTTHDIEKSVRIIVTSGLVNQERFSKGLRESLEPRLRAVRTLNPLCCSNQSHLNVESIMSVASKQIRDLNTHNQVCLRELGWR